MQSVVILCLVGLTGAGKSTLSQNIIRLGIAEKLQIVTTRPMRPSDQSDEYSFISQETYDEWVANNRFAMRTEWYGNNYGIDRKCVEDRNKKNCCVQMFVTPWAFGRENVIEGIKGVGIWLEVSQKNRFDRVLIRGDNSTFLENRRAIERTEEFSKNVAFQKQCCDWSVDNNQSEEEALEQIKNIILNETFRT